MRIGPAAGVTWVTDTVEFALRGPARIVEPLAGSLVRAILAQKLLRTKALLEDRDYRARRERGSG